MKGRETWMHHFYYFTKFATSASKQKFSVFTKKLQIRSASQFMMISFINKKRSNLSAPWAYKNYRL